jgi:hypothetical protein
MNEIQKKYIGKHLLIGLTYLEKDESVREQVQFHGNISAVSDSTIVFKRNDNGEEFSIPFDEENLKEGDPDAVYKLRSTGESVENVDYISSWTIHPPNDEDNL